MKKRQKRSANITFYPYITNKNREVELTEIPEDLKELIHEQLGDDKITLYSIKDTSINVKSSYDKEQIKDILNNFDHPIYFYEKKPEKPILKHTYNYAAIFSIPEMSDNENILDKAFAACLRAINRSSYQKLSRPIIRDGQLYIGQIISDNVDFFKYLMSALSSNEISYVEPDNLTLEFICYGSNYSTLKKISNKNKSTISKLLSGIAKKLDLQVSEITYKKNKVSISIVNPKRLVYDKIKQFIKSIPDKDAPYLFFTEFSAIS